MLTDYAAFVIIYILCTLMNRLWDFTPLMWNMDPLWSQQVIIIIIYRYKNNKGASVVALWIMGVKITGWSSDYTNRMCHGGHMGVFQHGGRPPMASAGRFIMQRLRVEHQQWRCSVGGRRQQAPSRQVCFYVFSFLPLEKQGGLQVAYQRPKSIKLWEESCSQSEA